MKRVLVFMIATFLVAQSVVARIGETLTQCKARYGRPLVHNERVTVFEKSGLQIGVIFLNGRAGAIQYEKLERNTIGIPEEFSENEIKILLCANGAGEWKKKLIENEWDSAAGNMAAGYDAITHQLGVFSTAYLNHSEKERNKKEAQNLGGF